ncbi:hypothetical protein OG585_44975 [Streptomyces sp. NBC_01340]|uniref:hypothetical protein n=1 Tax=unclassified Streptomyces TaxID=2593676 RepID=UPI0022531194|nr:MULTISPECIES: hypothetical protein [unclassified Streptomyces]MCX4459882.1 hypothetical protein [Streptomyces sp. NBC_01719]MCX4499240.1 hypothetical protein [Streptomyces sp. NBC_01728]WSI43648.1 hypothetical protein OG585_44975 [Streptomyces sp. NBC_01340]
MTSTDRIPHENDENNNALPRPGGRTLRWAQLILCAGGVSAAIAIWALGGSPLVAGAVATAVGLGNAGWHITVNVRR